MLSPTRGSRIYGQLIPPMQSSMLALSLKIEEKEQAMRTMNITSGAQEREAYRLWLETLWEVNNLRDFLEGQKELRKAVMWGPTGRQCRAEGVGIELL